MQKATKIEKPERINKVLAHAGFGSRRHVEDLILSGRVSINGRTVRELGTRVEAGQKLTVDGVPVKQEKLAYYLVNKPRGYLSTNYDPAGRPRVIDLVPQISQRVYTVGRLDEASEGLMLLTNDGELANRLMHPRFGVEKTYLAQVAGFPTAADINQLLEGIWISEGRVRAKKVRRLKSQKGSTWLRIVLDEGKNREIRRMLARLGHKVLALRRIAIGPVKIGALAPGKSRRLRHEELQELQEMAQHTQKKTSLSEIPPSPPGGEGSGVRGRLFPPSPPERERSGVRGKKSTAFRSGSRSKKHKVKRP